MKWILGLALLGFLFPPAPQPEKVDLSADELQRIATHVIQGNVRHIYQRSEQEDAWSYTHYVAEVQITATEKGEDLAEGGLVYVRYWTRRFRGSQPPPSTSGHRQIPSEGETLRIYLACRAYDGFTRENLDGGYNVIGANGFERLP